jgi:uncharacterized protein YkwD
MRHRHIHLSSLLVAGAILAAPAAPAGAAACANAGIAPTQANVQAVAHATTCLINQQRRRHHLRRLRRSASLELAARRHVGDMVSRGYFSHVTPSGLSARDRVRQAGYVRRGVSLLVGEDLSWAIADAATPRRTVARWMRSRRHRANILGRAYRHVGVGVAIGSPGIGSGGVTFAVKFARRG